MPLLDRLRKRAREAEYEIWSTGLYDQQAEDLRALLTEAADRLAEGGEHLVGLMRSVDGLIKANERIGDILNDRPL